MKQLDTPEAIFEQEKQVFEMLAARLRTSELLKEEHKQAIAYRLAELFVASRQLYTQVMPAFLEAEGLEDELLETLGEVRMNLLNIKDLVEDFEDVFLESLADRQGQADAEGDEGDGDDDVPSGPPIARG